MTACPDIVPGQLYIDRTWRPAAGSAAASGRPARPA